MTNLNNLFNKITLRDYYKNKWENHFAQKYMDDVDTYLTNNKIAVKRVDKLELKNCDVRQTLIVCTQGEISNNTMVNSRILAASGDEKA